MKKLILVVALSSFLNAQEASHLFAKYIPERYRNSVENINTVNTILNSIPEINTDLFFYFITALQIDDLNNSNELFKTFVKYIDYEKYKSDSLYNEWIGQQIDIINQSHLEEDIKRKASSNFVLLELKKKNYTTELFPLIIDSNIVAYYKMIFNSGQINSKYNPSINYHKNVENFENKILQEFRFVQKKLKDGTYPHTSNIPLFDKMEKNWHLFYKSSSKNDSLNEYIVDYYVHNYLIKDDFSPFNISFFYNQNSLLEFTHSGSTNTPLFIAINDKIITNQIGISFGYRFKLKEQKSIFSTLNLNVSFATGKIGNSRKLEDLETSTSEIVFNRKTIKSFNVKFINSRFNIKTLNYFDISLSVPIYYLTPDILLSFGGRVNYNSLVYDLEYEYESSVTFRTVDVDTDKLLNENTDNFSGSFNSNSNDNSLGIEPFILIEYQMVKNMNLGLNLGIKYFALFTKLKF